MTLVKWNPNQYLASLPNFLENWFDNFSSNAQLSDHLWSPSVDIVESKESYELAVEIPGLNKNDIHISLEDSVLRLSGERKQESKSENKNYHHIEITFGRFERSFRLPKNVKTDQINAKYKDGILKVEIPKAEEVKPKEITVL